MKREILIFFVNCKRGRVERVKREKVETHPYASPKDWNDREASLLLETLHGVLVPVLLDPLGPHDVAWQANLHSINEEHGSSMSVVA